MFSYYATRAIMNFAPAPEGADSEGQGVIMLVFYVGLFLIFYFLLIRPQTKEAQEKQVMQDGLSKGDRVVTSGGIFGTIHKVDDEVVTLEIADGVRVKVQRSAIGNKIVPAGSEKE